MKVISNEMVCKYSNGFFCREFCWNLPDILASFQCENGYILQKINRTTNASSDFWNHQFCKSDFEHSYFEAWKISHNKIEYPGIYQGFDDRWVYSSVIPSWESAMNDYKEKYGTAGVVRMEADVYWCPQDSITAHEITSSFKHNAIKWAGELLCSYECKEIESAICFYHHSFYNEWLLRNDREIIKALVQRFLNSELPKERVIRDIFTFFRDMPFYEALYMAVDTEIK